MRWRISWSENGELLGACQLLVVSNIKCLNHIWTWMIKPSCDCVNEQTWFLKYCSMLGGNEGHWKGNAFRKRSFPSKARSAEKKKKSYRKNSCISRTPNFQAWFWKKKKQKCAFVKKVIVCSRIKMFTNKLEEI